MTDTLPVIDLSRLLAGEDDAATAAAIDRAARDTGFFYLAGHGIPLALFDDVEQVARRFFALPEADKAAIAMARGGRAWRGWFPLGGELTSGRPDGKEGLYLGEELGPDDPRVAARWPLHGANLWPAALPELRPVVERWLAAVTRAAHALTRGASLALGLPGDEIARRYTARPTLLFRLFRYPPGWTGGDGVGEHTDYGLLTLLAQDRHGGLEVRIGDDWLAVPPREGLLVVNIGDMLDRLTGGRWRSTPHRVVNAGDVERISWPLFFDPAYDARIEPLIAPDPADVRSVRRWDGIDPGQFDGSYGDYLFRKVGAVFPQLARTELD
ncbi:isopenicillin N synthase family dioxygenase [Sphingomonas sp. GlSt437]|uniref:isopenicillin N synthase family dioxygenase n=1 Tax=Sphingomonas sp. GlSt437 TaxID=3389970 RepID=UPI003A8A65FC